MEPTWADAPEGALTWQSDYYRFKAIVHKMVTSCAWLSKINSSCRFSVLLRSCAHNSSDIYIYYPSDEAFMQDNALSDDFLHGLYSVLPPGAPILKLCDVMESCNARDAMVELLTGLIVVRDDASSSYTT